MTDNIGLHLAHIGKEYNFVPILEDVNLLLPPGSVYLLSAPNGSGKTTLLKIAAGLSKPSTGQVSWNSELLNVSNRRQFGVLLQEPWLYKDLTGLENLMMYAQLYDIAEARTQVALWLSNVGMEEAASVRIQAYSKGMRQRLGIARTFLHEPSVYLLDEPLDGLDREGAEAFHEALKQAVGRGGSAFVVTHNPETFHYADACFGIEFGRLFKR